MNPDAFEWSDDAGQFVYRDEEGRYPCRLTIEMSMSDPTDEEKSAAVTKAVENFPGFLLQEPSHRKHAHQQIHEELGGDFPAWEAFSPQMKLEEACLVDGEGGHLYYAGVDDLAGYRFTIFCDGLEFDFAEIDEVE